LPIIIHSDIKKGCGGTIQAPDFEFIFEIHNDSVNFIRLWAAVKLGKYQDAGIVIKEKGCKKERSYD
jgi:hypothetical protein